MHVEMDKNGNIKSKASGIGAVSALGGILNAHIRSNLLIKMGLYVLSGVFVITASILIVFAPDGRQTEVSFVAVALIVLAIGAAGFGTFAIKAPGLEVQGGSPRSEN